ncbi:MAG: nucleotidyltransferase substrate binding protein [Treponema sp.]|jgi:nucleotidyltransferase substrate binding protein (TIGR01987 family)|nr:nucleotidyltransferase substrate binding protein [Treponema sp.]
MIDYEKFERSLKHLEAQLQNFCDVSKRPELLKLDREAIAESVVQRFEVCYDCLWKVLKRYLGEELGISNLPNSPKPLFRIAFENQLFPAVDPWLSYADARVDTSHDYSEEKAGITIGRAFDFVKDTAILYEKMTGKPWT